MPTPVLLVAEDDETDALLLARALRWPQESPGRSRLPRVVLTSSLLHEELERACELGASSPVIKPTQADRLEAIAASLHDGWVHSNVGSNPALV